ncbi:MAG TPA: hypothetical protein ENH82_09685 [bacterium]|nr:hypothetical protein [bacterium]
MITKQQWQVFQLRNQERRSWPIISELMGIDIPEAKEILQGLRKQEPELFPVDNERFNLGKQLTQKERRGIDVIHIDDIAEEDIRQKF